MKDTKNRSIFRYLHKNGRAAQPSRVPSNRIRDSRLCSLITTDKAELPVQVFLSKYSLVFQHVTERCHVTKSPHLVRSCGGCFSFRARLKLIHCIPSRVSFSLSSSQ
ncbi:hypothetical protein NPIL_696521 [Nephila pilipes]|uniref:Uncharacterized protein n=1 Tax=Nephila pilipes TaxID=299642 RepID=A0A8X6PYK4_NEPPI|nr:hypothetical protein NPIL_367821 [Nephila pilipes]GFU42695.1 hypothetical protein NPIL_696521 [Nephila pilipes]